MKIGRGKIVAATAAVAVSAWLAIGSAAANEIFQQQTGKSCGDCHHPNQEKLGVKGLNAMGLAFKDCGYKFGCAAAPAAAPKKTSENHNGVITIGNHTTCPGQTRMVALRAGGNSKDRDIVLFIESGQNVKVGVSRGTTWVTSCGTLNDSQQFFWVPLDQTVD